MTFNWISSCWPTSNARARRRGLHRLSNNPHLSGSQNSGCCMLDMYRERGPAKRIHPNQFTKIKSSYWMAGLDSLNIRELARIGNRVVNFNNLMGAFRATIATNNLACNLQNPTLRVLGHA